MFLPNNLKCHCHENKGKKGGSMEGGGRTELKAMCDPGLDINWGETALQHISGTAVKFQNGLLHNSITVILNFQILKTTL